VEPIDPFTEFTRASKSVKKTKQCYTQCICFSGQRKSLKHNFNIWRVCKSGV